MKSDTPIFAPYLRIAYFIECNYKSPKRILAKRKLHDYELFYLKSGSGILELESKKIELLPGYLYLIQPGEAHSMLFSEVYCEYLHFDLFYNPNRAKSYVVPGGQLDLETDFMQTSINTVIDTPLKTKIKITNLEEVERIFKKLIENYRNPNYINTLFQQEELIKLIQYFFKGTETQNNISKVEYRINEINSFLQANIHRKVSIDELSKLFSISKYYLIHLFKKEYNISPIHLHNKMQMEKAALRLKTSNISITNLAFELDFESPYTFSRSFKRFHKISPANYRKNL